MVVAVLMQSNTGRIARQVLPLADWGAKKKAGRSPPKFRASLIDFDEEDVSRDVGVILVVGVFAEGFVVCSDWLLCSDGAAEMF